MVLLFLTQASLAATGRMTVHRRMGIVAPLLAVLLIVLGAFTVIEGARRGYDLSGDFGRAFAPPGSPPPNPAAGIERTKELAAGIWLPLSGFLNFGMLVAAALWCRHRPDIHKRLMLFALIPLAGEAIIHLQGYLRGHWPDSGLLLVISAAIGLFLVSASAIHGQASEGRIHPVSFWVPTILTAEGSLLNPLVVASPAWQEFAVWLLTG